MSQSEDLPQTATEHSTAPDPPITAPLKPPVAQLLYIQTQPKLPFSTLPKASTQLQFATIPNQATPNQSVILTPVKNVAKTQQLVIHKPVTLASSKLAGTYLTMFKPLSKIQETSEGQKLVIAPMPKVIKNRLPVTVTTNSLQQKIAFMPVAVPQKVEAEAKDEKEYELSIVEESNSNLEGVEKRFKHGVSILKKSQGEKKTSANNSSIPEADPGRGQKTERRRKSQFSYRRDYDDMEIIEDNFINYPPAVNSVKKRLPEVETTKPNKKPDINMNDDFDLQKVLKWEEGIGSLPGSDLKFIVNEFNLIEYVTREEYDRMLERRHNKPNQQKVDLQEDLQCLECGCFGLPTEFINTKYCSLDCQQANIKMLKEKELKLKAKKKRQKVEVFSASDEDTSNDNSQDRFAYPWACSKKGFSWTKYLDHIKAKAAPVKLFKDAFPYNRNGFRPGMKMEGIDPQHPSYFCVLTVAEVCGYRLRLHFDGYPENYDFWSNADSMDIFPAGWCEKHGHALQAPPGYKNEHFNWMMYLKVTKTTAAPKHLFANRAGSAICPNGFRVGMKLEAVDRKDSSLVCVASVRDMMDNRILVHFDSWDDIYDYWADPTSPYIHPVGWCHQYGHNLTPPNDYPNKESFSWEKYLKETKSVAAPVRAFKQRPACGFRRGMRLECVDRRVPQLIRVATVDETKDHRIRIHFDGWPDRYSYWLDDDSEDIHPVGWCQKTGHPIETPLTPDDVYDFLECPTVGCRGMGHIQGPKFATHSEQKFCPYAEDNIDAERVLPDRLLSPDRLVESVIPVSIEPTERPRPRIGRPPKQPPTPPEDGGEEEPPKAKPKRRYRKRLKQPSEDDGVSAKLRKIEAFIQESRVEPAAKESLFRHRGFLKRYVHNVNGEFLNWKTEDVAYLVSKIRGLQGHSECFRMMDIDGEAFLSLSQNDLIDILGIKVGPAVKLYNIIVLLRERVSEMS